MDRKWISWGAILAMIAVVLGAFGAHGLREALPADQLAVFHTGVRYQFYHAFALLFLGLWAQHSTPDRWLRWAAVAFLLGVLMFSGSLYLLSMRSLLGDWVRPLGPVTPLGGLSFIVGWSLLLFHLYNSRRKISD